MINSQSWREVGVRENFSNFWKDWSSSGKSESFEPTTNEHKPKYFVVVRHGNWNDISRYVETKGPTECRDIVNQNFVDGKVYFSSKCCL